MIDIIKAFLSKIYDVLPDSPFQTFFGSVDFDFLGWLNWFIPFDLCFKITEAWVSAIAAYYLYSIVRRVAFDLILKKFSA